MGKLMQETAIPPKRTKNSDRRSREYLTPNEIDKLLNAAKQVGRYSQRNATMILMAYRPRGGLLELLN